VSNEEWKKTTRRRLRRDSPKKISRKGRKGRKGAKNAKEEERVLFMVVQRFTFEIYLVYYNLANNNSFPLPSSLCVLGAFAFSAR
jgi:hypothetical protein